VPLDWSTASTWKFEPLDETAFPAVALARRVGAAGGCFPAVFNAANEEAVAAFHEGRIGFLDIVDTIDRVVDEFAPESGEVSIRILSEAEDWARAAANTLISS
jgi:1-deoxy-D-xylulose-5-phosphate reductoisomerase